MKLVLRTSLLAVALALPASAKAPNDQYDYFTDQSSSISDRFTGLTWSRSTVQKTKADADSYCLGLSMRLPTVKELLTIVDEEPHLRYDGTQNVVKYIDESAFPNTPASTFWTSSAVSASKYRTVDFSDGTTSDTNAGSTAFVRCVSSH